MVLPINHLFLITILCYLLLELFLQLHSFQIFFLYFVLHFSFELFRPNILTILYLPIIIPIPALSMKDTLLKSNITFLGIYRVMSSSINLLIFSVLWWSISSVISTNKVLSFCKKTLFILFLLEIDWFILYSLLLNFYRAKTGKFWRFIRSFRVYSTLDNYLIFPNKILQIKNYMI